MTGRGLITVNKMLSLLAQEIMSSRCAEYNNLLLEKVAVSKNIKAHKSPSQIEELLIILLKQIKFVSYYTEKYPRIKRILYILDKGKARITGGIQADIAK